MIPGNRQIEQGLAAATTLLGMQPKSLGKEAGVTTRKVATSTLSSLCLGPSQPALGTWWKSLRAVGMLTGEAK